MTRGDPPGRAAGAASKRSRLRAAVESPSRAESRETAGWEEFPLDGSGPDIDSEELREFMAPEGDEAQADPVFKERLRRTLWRLLRARASAGEDPLEE